ncbi:hypothetical protein L1987_31713 [Smallanthus sonchifolius]|uniref:Uncharacterized protein n=1 Tax=Smallanthus sonchifolius TaxID=185202 RepID=A0ACB9I663_9ASTR|nr:hypothetical protein L1987_31713 [Smallanthus sonchifolius]
MRGPKTTATVAQKKLNPDTTKKTKFDKSAAKKEKASNKNSGAPKRPPSAFFVFIIDRAQSSINFETAYCELDLDLRLMRFGVHHRLLRKAELNGSLCPILQKESRNETASASKSSSLNTHDDVKQEASSLRMKVLKHVR